MAVTTPTADELRSAAERLGLPVSEEELTTFALLSEGVSGFFHRIDQLEEPARTPKYPRSGGHRPSAGEDPLNAWYWKCAIQGAPCGPLHGRRIAIKDNVCVAGMPMMNGSSVLEGYVPETDATVVQRILDAGGEIAGKAVCESFCLSGASHTADTGPTHNPHRQGYSSGGSSSGSAALVAGGEVDMAIGADQAGSIRVPGSWCGIYGLKPTFGLVPYTGAALLEYTIDHLGPMTRTVEDAALLLAVIAGPDGCDSRQAGARQGDYVGALTGEVGDLRIGVVQEAFGWPGMSAAEVDAAVKGAARRFEKLGARVVDLSLPFHRDGLSIYMGFALEGVSKVITSSGGVGSGWRGTYPVDLMRALNQAMTNRAERMAPGVKFILMLGQHMQEKYGGLYYAKSQNLRQALTRDYDSAFTDCDLLLMPTTPMQAQPLPADDAPMIEKIAKSMQQVANTCPFDLTGHPAMNVPCGVFDGLPIGMQLIGRYWQEATLLRAAHAFEQAGG